MPRYQSQPVPQEKFLTVAVNLLQQYFVEAARTDADTTYRQLVHGDPVHLTNVRMDDGSTSCFNVKLDCSEYRGDLDYVAFRDSLATLIANFVYALNDAREINVFNAQQNDDSMLFGVTAVTLDDDQPNVMVLGSEFCRVAGEVMLNLMYLDPSQFVEQESREVESDEPT